MRKKRCKKLTPEQKKTIWSKPESNAGCGWHSTGQNPVDFEEKGHTSSALQDETELDFD